MLSLICLALSFISNVIFLSEGHFGQANNIALLYALSHEFVLLLIFSKFSMSVAITASNFVSSSNFWRFFWTCFNLRIESIISSLKFSKIIFPHIVLEKSWVILSFKLNFSTCSSNHNSGNGLLWINLYIFKISSLNFSSPL